MEGRSPVWGHETEASPNERSIEKQRRQRSVGNVRRRTVGPFRSGERGFYTLALTSVLIGSFGWRRRGKLSSSFLSCIV